MDSCWTCGNPFHSYENCLEEKASREERVLETYDYRSQYDYYEHDTYHVDYNIGMKDYMMYRGQRQDDNHLYNLDQKLDKLMSIIESNKEENQRAFETEVGRLAEQLNREETYEPQGITVLDFDDEDEGEEQYEELTLHSTNTMQWSTFSSHKDEEDGYNIDDHSNSLHDPNFPVKGHHEESVPLKVKEEVVEATTTPYLTTLKEPIPSSIEDTKSKEDEEFLALSLYKDECSNLLEEVKFTHTDQTLPQIPQVLTNKVGMDDLSYTKV
ncbi:hypothetical protein Tco_0012615 [Tanacetum coccineum]